MSDQVQLRGGTTAQHANFTGAVRECTVDTTKRVLVVHDGATPGGNPMMGSNGGTFTGLVNMATANNIASAATIDLTAATGNIVDITGTVATSALIMNAGQRMTLVAQGAWPLTYNATTMKINGGQSYTCAAGDRVEAFKDLAGIIYVNITRNIASATVLQVVPVYDAGSSTTATARTNMNTAVFNITPKSSSSTLVFALGFQAGIASLGGVNTTGYFDISEGGVAKSSSYSIQAPSGSGGNGSYVPASLFANISNTVLTQRSFSIYAYTNNASAAVMASNICGHIMEIQN